MEPESIFLPAQYWRLVRSNPNYRRLWAAQVVSEIGDWFYTVAIYSLLLELTGKAASVALALVLQVLPPAIMGPLAGVVNDRLSRRKVMIAADVVRAGIVLLMLLVRSRELLWLAYLLLLLEMVMTAFFEPARSAAIPNITEREQLTLANTLSAATWSANMAIGSALGGVAGLLLGRNAVFVLNALSFVVSALLIVRMRFEEPHTARSTPLRARELVDYSPVVEGARYLAGEGPRLVTVFAKAGLGILGTAWVLFPVMGARLFPVHSAGGGHGGMMGLSLLMAAHGVGSMLGPLLSAQWVKQDERRLRRAILLGFALAGCGYLALSFAPSLAAACAFVMLAHSGSSNVWVHSTTLLQLRTEDEYRGRAFAAEMAFFMVIFAISASAAGYALDHGLSMRALAVITGLAMFVPTTVWALSARAWKQPTSSEARGTDARN